MKKVAKIKTYVKAILVSRAMDDTLPLDMTELDVDGLFDLAEACIKAEDLLSYNGCVELVEQVRAIINEENKAKMIDHIDNVCPIEKFEFTFTVKDFLGHIGM